MITMVELNRFRWFWLVIFALTLSFSQAHSAEITLDKVLEEWKQRTKLCQAIELTWEISETRYSKEAAVPISAKRVCKTRVDGIRAWYQVNGFHLDEETIEVKPINYTQAYDGTEGRLLFDEVMDKEGTKYPHGFVSANNEAMENAQLFSVLWAISPLGDWDQGFHVLSRVENAETQGVDCLVLEEKMRVGRKSIRKIWVDEKCRIRRVESRRAGELTQRFELAYPEGENAPKCLVPVSWEFKRFLPYGITESLAVAKVNAQSIKVGSIVSPEGFQIDFSVGAIVVDSRSHENYIVCKNGKRRVILPDEMGATYRELSANTSGETAPRQQ